MEYQLVPSCKHGCGKIKKQRRGEQSKKENNHECEARDDSKVYILQPMFKPPKSTKELVSAADDDLGLAVKVISDSNKDNDKSGKYNHFTMTRKGMVKYNGLSRVEDPFNPLSPSPNRNYTTDSEHMMYSHQRRASCMPQSSKQSNERSRRASAGDELFKTKMTQRQNSGQGSNHNDISDYPRIVSLGPDEMFLIPYQKHESHDFHQANGQTAKRMGSGGKVGTQDNRLQVLENQIPRRKSFHDWYSMQEWYSPEPRPVSTEVTAKRNVISPNTLSRMIPSQDDDQRSRNGSASISVCTEGDRMSYNFNLPSRRLVSHKELKNCRLPYNDNIGLEETVSSDQAKKAAKTKQSIVCKKKTEPTKQTPKQVWHRTVRSILAANYLYHSVKRKA